MKRYTNNLVLIVFVLSFRQVLFEVSDATKREFLSGRFDAVYSRETIFHIKDKKALFQKILVSRAGINWTSISSLFVKKFYKYKSEVHFRPIFS